MSKVIPLILGLCFCQFVCAQELFVIGDASRSEPLISEIRSFEVDSDGWEIPLVSSQITVLDLGCRDTQTVELVLEGLRYVANAPETLVIPGDAIESASVLNDLKELRGTANLVVDSPSKFAETPEWDVVSTKFKVDFAQRRLIDELRAKGEGLRVLVRPTGSIAIPNLPETLRHEIAEISRNRSAACCKAPPIAKNLIDLILATRSIINLDLGDQPLHQGQVLSINRQPNLKTLWLDNCEIVEDAILSNNSLVRLDISNTSITLKGLPSLRELHRKSTKTPLAAFKGLSFVDKIETLDISASELSAEDVAVLNEMAALKSIRLANCKFPAQLFEQMQFSQVVYLDVSGLRDIGSSLPNLANVETLVLDGSSIRFNDASELEPFRRLKRISARGIPLVDEVKRLLSNRDIEIFGEN
jgi:hypothetical protein